MTDDRPAPSSRRLYPILACLVLALVAGPIGTAAFVLGFWHGESPCILCWAQRTGMTLIALTGLFILRFGPRPRYAGIAILLAVDGVYMGLRHSALHVARDIGQGFSAEILGAHTNTWSMLIFWSAAVVMAVLVATLRDGEATRHRRTLTRFEAAVAWLFLAAVAGNAVQAFASTGPPPYVGQSDPVRFSFDPRHWVWSLEEWSPVPIGLRGRWAVPRPDVSALSSDPAAGSFVTLPALATTRTLRAPEGLDGRPTGLAFDPATDRFLLTTEHGLSLVDAAFTRILGRTVVDPGFSVDLAPFGDVAFLDSHTLLALSENKSFVILRENAHADAAANFRYFLVPGPFDEVRRGRFATVRARMMFVRSVAFDRASNAIFTISLPNPRAPTLVVSRFDRGDLTLSEEFLPTLAANSGLSLKPGRSIDELHVTAATMGEGRLYGMSAAFGTLVEIDPSTRRLTAAYALAGARRPVGIAIRNGELYVAAEDGTIAVVTLPSIR